MLSFKEFIDYSNIIEESEDKPVVISFGRLNPPSLGHKKLMDHMVKLANQSHGKALLFLSHTNDTKKNPLPYDLKYKYVKSAAPSGLDVVNSPARTIFEVMKVIGEMGYKNVILVVGQDRVNEFKTRLEKYLGDYGITSFKVVSAGNRTDGGDVNNVEDISASLLRKLAATNKKEEFIKGSILANKPRDAEKLYQDVRRGLGLKENEEMSWDQLNTLLYDKEKGFYGLDFIDGDDYSKGVVMIHRG